MDSRAMEIASLLLRETALRKGNAAHDQVYSELMADANLYEEVRSRLRAVGYEPVQFLGHLGLRVTVAAEQAFSERNRMGLHAGHIRMIVYLWVHLVYRQWVNLRRGTETAPPGGDQGALFTEGADERPWMSYKEVFATFSDSLKRTPLKGVISTLRRLRFITYSESEDRIWPDACLYVLVDRQRMEDFVVELARRMGTDDAVSAVTAVATGSSVSEEAGEEGDDDPAT